MSCGSTKKKSSRPSASNPHTTRSGMREAWFELIARFELARPGFSVIHARASALWTLARFLQTGLDCPSIVGHPGKVCGAVARAEIRTFLIARERLGRAALVVVLAEIALWCQAVMILQLPHAADVSDYRAYDVAARITLHQGCSHTYDTALQLRVLRSYWPGASPLDSIS